MAQLVASEAMGRCLPAEYVPVKSRAGQWNPEARQSWRRPWRCHTDRYCRRHWNEIADLEEHGVVVTGRKRGWSPIGQASPDGALRPAGIVNACAQVGQATAGWYLLLASATWKSLQQPDTRRARPVWFSTTTRPGIDDPAVIIRDGSTTQADIGAEER